VSKALSENSFEKIFMTMMKTITATPPKTKISTTRMAVVSAQ